MRECFLGANGKLHAEGSAQYPARDTYSVHVSRDCYLHFTCGSGRATSLLQIAHLLRVEAKIHTEGSLSPKPSSGLFLYMAQDPLALSLLPPLIPSLFPCLWNAGDSVGSLDSGCRSDRAPKHPSMHWEPPGLYTLGRGRLLQTCWCGEGAPSFHPARGGWPGENEEEAEARGTSHELAELNRQVFGS